MLGDSRTLYGCWCCYLRVTTYYHPNKHATKQTTWSFYRGEVTPGRMPPPPSTPCTNWIGVGHRPDYTASFAVFCTMSAGLEVAVAIFVLNTRDRELYADNSISTLSAFVYCRLPHPCMPPCPNAPCSCGRQ